MTLETQLASLTSRNTVVTINHWLNDGRVEINWYGQRVLTVEQLGSVEIDQVARKFLNAHAFQFMEQPTLQERLDAHQLWGRIRKLYQISDERLSSTWAIKILTYIKEFKPYMVVHAQNVREHFETMGVRGLSNSENSPFLFTPEQFKAIWQEQRPVEQFSIRFHGKTIEGWSANKEMVEAALPRG